MQQQISNPAITMDARDEIATIHECNFTRNRENETVVAAMGGALLIESDPFPYFALIAFDVGGILRLLLLLLASLIAAFLHRFVSESTGIRVLIFATFAGVKLSEINSAAGAVLPKHYSEDLHSDTWRVFSSCGRKCVLTASPRVMVEPFLKNYLDVDIILGTEISSFKGFATGLVARGGVLVGEKKADALKRVFGDEEMPHVGIGDRDSNIPFIQLCKEKYRVPKRAGARSVNPSTLPKPVIFHDGRLVQKPTVLRSLLILLWLPIGITLSIIRLACISIFPISMAYRTMNLLGCPITARGPPNLSSAAADGGTGTVFVCNHRTLVDPVIISACLHRTTTTITYSVAPITELISPIETTRLTRRRSADARLIGRILDQGKLLVICAEGTTCREPYLLRFSALFAELARRIVPVAVSVETGIFHGTTARGRKWLDPFFFYMNPSPAYDVTFLEALNVDRSGKSSFDVANDVQGMIGEELGYKCTNLTRKDKYRALVGTDGNIVDYKHA